MVALFVFKHAKKWYLRRIKVKKKKYKIDYILQKKNGFLFFVLWKFN